MAEIATLKNGLRIACDEMKEVETVSVGVFVKAGSRNEEVEINGISHFLEHMAFKGTKKRNALQIAEEFENIGGRINAYTSKERTVYYAKVLKKDAEFAVEFLSDIIQNSVFDEVELEKERGVILQEIAMTNDTPDDIIFDYFQETAYKNQAIGRPILGPTKNIKKFNRDHFVNYIQNNYNAENIALVASGNIKQKDLVKWGEKYFNNLNKKKTQKEEKAQYVGGEFLKNKKLEQINLVMGFEGVNYLSDDYYKAQILSSILGGGMSSRLFQEIRENLGLAYSIYAFNYAYQDSGVFGIYSASTAQKAKKLIEATKKEIEKICEKGVNDQELKRAKTQFEASILMAKESTSSRMQKLGSNILSHNRIIKSDEIIEKLNKISKKEIKNIAHKFFANKKPETFSAIGQVKFL